MSGANECKVYRTKYIIRKLSSGFDEQNTSKLVLEEWDFVKDNRKRNIIIIMRMKTELAI